MRLEKLNNKINELSLNTEDYSNEIFNFRLDEIREEIADTKRERDQMIPSLHVRRLRSEKAMVMKAFLNETEEVNDENIDKAIYGCIEKIIVIDNDLETESIDIYLINGLTINVKFINKKKRKCVHTSCYREMVENSNAQM